MTTYPTCQGKNCCCTDGVNHSQECKAEHEAIVNAAAMADHVANGGWKCFFCGYGGQENVACNQFCSNCRRHK